MDAVLEHGRRYLTMKHGLWLLKAGLKETHIILLISSDYTEVKDMQYGFMKDMQYGFQILASRNRVT